MLSHVLDVLAGGGGIDGLVIWLYLMILEWDPYLFLDRTFHAMKGGVQRTLSWVENTCKRWALARDLGAGYYFFIFLVVAAIFYLAFFFHFRSARPISR
jgi:hypothetical protein